VELRTFEFQLDGKVTVDSLFHAVDAWRATFSHLAQEIGTKNIVDNRITDLQGGSAIAMTEVSFADQESADRFTSLFENTALHARGDILTPPPESIRVPVGKLRVAAREASQDGIVWRTPDQDFLILPIRADVATTSYSPSSDAITNESIGVITGRLESLSSRQGLRAVIYDHVFDKAVRFTLDESLKEKVRDMWDKPVEAVGVVRRDGRTGRPLSIHDVTNISPVMIAGDPWAWKSARGVLKHVEPGVPTEDLLARIWDE